MFKAPKYKTKAHVYEPTSIFSKHEDIVHKDRTVKVKKPWTVEE